jgi:hypothetical protein
MYTIKPFKHKSTVLTEAGQSNPIRWALVSKKDDVLTPKSPWFKCKDYFNDVVAAKHEMFFTQYGFNNKTMSSYKDDGAYVMVNFIDDTASFQKDVEAIMKPEFPVLFEDLPDQMMLLYIPEHYFENTYRISLLTYLIRASNRPVGTPANFESVTQAFKSPVVLADHVFPAHIKAKLSAIGWDCPNQDLWWWASGTTHNNVTCSDTGSAYQGIIHNAGVCSWLR